MTPPPTPATPIAAAYVVGTNVTFSWNSVTDTEGGISGYHVLIGTTPGGSNVFNGTVTTTNQLASGNYGQTLYARVAAINNARIESSFSGISSGTILLDPNVDSDSDGMSNANELIAGTNPLEANSVLRILSLSTGNLLTWSSVSGMTYQVHATTDLMSNLIPLTGVITGAAPTATYLDTSATNAARFYRVKVWP